MSGTRRSFGNVRQKPSGRWEARYQDAADTTHYATFETKRQAADHLARISADLQRGTWTDPTLSRITVQEWAVVWMEGMRNLRPNTERLYRSLLRCHVLPAFGHMRLDHVTPEDVDAWVAVLLANERICSTTANRAYRILRQMMKLAVRRRRIPFSPCEGVTAPADAKAEMLFLTPGQVVDLAEAIKPHYRNLVLTAVYSGLRWGELAGLQVARLDLLNRTVAVVAQLTDHNTLAPPKTAAGRRVVTLPRWMVDLLRTHVAGMALDGYLFTTEDGALLGRSNFTTRVWKPAVKAALPPHLHALRFHDLRHTAVAIAIQSGAAANPKALQMRMGHNSIVTTLDRYGHLLPGADATIADGMADPFADRAKVIRLDERRSV